MAAKDDLVVDLVEEEEEEWPEAGVQNVEEAERYQDKNKQHFRSSFGPHPSRHKKQHFHKPFKILKKL